MQKQQLLYKGKAKSVYETEDNDLLILHSRDDTSALNGERIEQRARKGVVKKRGNAFIMQKLSAAGIETHFSPQLSDDEVLLPRLEMLPVECVVRHFAAFRLVRRLGLEEGRALNPPTYELFYKDDALGDPLINDSLTLSLGWATEAQLAKMKELTYQVNEVLTELFAAGDLMLIDFKLEFGVFHDRIVLGDEFSPDGCRIWDKTTKKKLDKDRFRQSLGDVIEGYEEVAKRIGVPLE